MKRLKWCKPFRVDVLIFDSLGVRYLKAGLPKQVLFTVLSFRDQVPVYFSLQLLVTWVKVARKYKLGVSQAYTLALIDSFHPKVVLSFADLHSALGFYQLYRRDALVIAIQNAIRYPEEFSPLVRAPHYFAIGNTAKRSFDVQGIPFQTCIPAGSLALGIYCSRNTVTRKQGKLVFISSYRVVFERPSVKGESEPYTQAQARAHEIAFNHTLRYAEESDSALTVIAKGKVRYAGEHFAEEKSYFDRLANGREYTLSSTVKDTYNSYQQALTAEFIFSLDSTLAYEGFSVGARILFCWGVDGYLSRRYEDFARYLPRAALLDSADYDEFSTKVNFLRGLNNESYDELTKGCRSEYVACLDEYPVHERIKREITTRLRQ